MRSPTEENRSANQLQQKLLNMRKHSEKNVTNPKLETGQTHRNFCPSILFSIDFLKCIHERQMSNLSTKSATLTMHKCSLKTWSIHVHYPKLLQVAHCYCSETAFMTEKRQLSSLQKHDKITEWLLPLNLTSIHATCLKVHCPAWLFHKL